jgi:hypothetical protein
MAWSHADRCGEGDEGDWDAVTWRAVDGELVVTAAQVLHKGLAGGDHRHRARPFSPRPQPSLEPTMVRLDPIVLVDPHRPHRALGLVAPQPRREQVGTRSSERERIVRRDVLGGLIHEYDLVA